MQAATEVASRTKLAHQAVRNSIAKRLQGGRRSLLFVTAKQLSGLVHNTLAGVHTTVNHRIHVRSMTIATGFFGIAQLTGR